MRPRLLLLLALVVGIALSCKRPAWDVARPADQEAVVAELAAFERSWLQPARIPAPVVDLAPQERAEGDRRITVAPLRPEDADWNTWPGPTMRLFNNRAALMFEVTFEGDAPLRWLPEETRLEINVEGAGLAPAQAADELLVPVLRAALLQEGYGLPGDYVERTRAAGAFRSAYLPLGAGDSPLTGVIGFPLAEPEQHVVAMRLTVGVQDAAGAVLYRFDFE